MSHLRRFHAVCISLCAKEPSISHRNRFASHFSSPRFEKPPSRCTCQVCSTILGHGLTYTWKITPLVLNQVSFLQLWFAISGASITNKHMDLICFDHPWCFHSKWPCQQSSRAIIFSSLWQTLTRFTNALTTATLRTQCWPHWRHRSQTLLEPATENSHNHSCHWSPEAVPDCTAKHCKDHSWVFMAILSCHSLPRFSLFALTKKKVFVGTMCSPLNKVDPSNSSGMFLAWQTKRESGGRKTC